MSQGILQDIICNLNSVVYRLRLTPHPRIEFVSSQISTLLGFEPGEMTDPQEITFEDYFSFEDASRMRASIQKLAEEPGDLDFVGSMKRKDGSPVTVRFEGRAHRAQDGSIYLDGVAFETEEESAQKTKANHELVALYKGLDQVVPIVVTGPGGHTLWANDAFCSYVGRSFQDIIGQEYVGWDPGSLGDQVLAMNSCLEENKGWSGEIEFTRADNETRICKVIAIPIRNEMKELEKVMEVRIDLTDERAAQSLMKEQEAQLIAASKFSQLGEMAGGIAHEINNPLAVIGTSAEALKGLLGRDPLDKERVEKNLERIIRVVDRIAKIVKSLRLYSRDARGDEAVELSVGDVVADGLELIREKIQSGGCKLEINNHLSESSRVLGRATELAQVIVNLVSNAKDAIEEKEDKWIRIDIEEEAKTVVIRVSDSGSGIEPSVAEKIFQPFFTTKDVGKGTGLGLSLCQRIIENHNGTLTLDKSKPNTCFVIKLPASKKESSGAVA